MTLRREGDDVVAGDEGEVRVFLDRGMGARMQVDGAIEVDEGGVAVRFSVVEDAAHAGLIG